MQKKKILIIDDEEDFCFFVKQNLEISGAYSVAYVTNAEKAIAAIKKESPDLLLMDIMMPKKDGFKILAEIKESSDMMSLPVVMVSALGVEENLLKASALYSEGFVTKPVAQESLCRKIEEVLARPPFINRAR